MTDDEVAQATELLKKLNPGFLPYSIFQQVTRLIATPIFELVPLRKASSGELEVLLLNRGPDDAWWPNQLHTPGVVIRADDVEQDAYDNRVAFERLIKDELLATQLGPLHFVGNILQKSKRGTEQAQVYWAEVLGDNKVGDFYPVSALPDSLIEGQRHFIHAAAEAYRHDR